MFDAIAHFIETKSRTRTSPPEVAVARKAPPQTKPETRDQQYVFTKVFRWPVPADQTPQPTKVEVVGSFSDWQRVPLAYDKPTNTWLVTLNNLKNNHTHRYVILVNDKPTYDKTCDGLTVPESPAEAKWQIETPRGPRVLLLFAQTR